MKGEIGYEHYFINYFLFIPFSRDQECESTVEAIKIMIDLNIIKESDYQSLLNSVLEISNKIKEFNSCDTTFFKTELSKPNKMLRLGYNFNENIYDENNKNINNIVYGDYKYKNENVEVFLHQRTMKKVKYKKRTYDLIHPINKQTIEKCLSLLKNYQGNTNSYTYSSQELNKLKNKFN